MKKFLKDLFTPTPENGMMPRALSETAFVVYLVLVVAFLVSPAYVRRLQVANLSSPFKAYSVVELVNASRMTLGLPALKESEALSEAAWDKAEDIFNKQYFAHISPERKTPWDFIKARDYTYTAAGENLAIDFISPEEAHRSLMESPAHRANILNRLYTEIGVAVAQGNFENRPSVVIVQYFGNPRGSVVPKPAPAASEAASIAPAAPASKPAPAYEPEPAALTVTAAVLPNPSSTGEAPDSAVLGLGRVENLLPFSDVLPSAKSRWEGLLEYFCPCIRTVSLGILALVLFSLTFLATRMRGVPVDVAFKSILLVTVLGYLVLTGGGEILSPQVTPAPFFTIEIVD